MLCTVEYSYENMEIKKNVPKLYITLTAYNKLLRHILRLKGCEVDAVALYWG